MNPTPRDPSTGSGSRGEADSPRRTSEGRHRRAEPDTGFRAGVAARRLVAPVVAVLAVVAVVGALLIIGHQPVHTGNLAGGNFSALPGTNSTPFPPAAGGSHRHKSQRTSPSPTVRSGHRRPAERASSRGSHRSQPSAPAPTVMPVTVLNNSRIQGLAHHVAAEFEAHGWPIAKIGNFTGRLPQTTVFYLAGEQAAARRLVAEFPGYAGISQLEPRPTGLPGAGLTVVLTRYWES